MNIIVGATGQVGSHLLKEIVSNGFPARAVVRDPGKLRDSNVEFRLADLFDAGQLTDAFRGGTTVFLLTPENPLSEDVIGDTQRIVENYRIAIQEARIEKIIGLSSIGAQNEGKTGNLLMSRMLEHAFDDLPVEKLFIRPSYYFSNWLGFLEPVEQYGVLPAFFPADKEVEMNSPVDVAKFIARVMTGAPVSRNDQFIELVGPRKYSARDVANVLSRLYNKVVTAQSIPKEKWKETLLTAGFTSNAADHLMDMTQAVIDNKTIPERPDAVVKLTTTLENYLEKQLEKQPAAR